MCHNPNLLFKLHSVLPLGGINVSLQKYGLDEAEWIFIDHVDILLEAFFTKTGRTFKSLNFFNESTNKNSNLNSHIAKSKYYINLSLLPNRG